MKTNLCKLFCLLGFHFALYAVAQTPEKMTYQSVVRDVNGQLVSNANVSVWIRIIKGGVEGVSVFEERHEAMTNFSGLLTFEIGNGSQQIGRIADIAWGNDTYYMESTFQLSGENAVPIIQIHQITSVPYALHAKTAENSVGGNYLDLENQPNIKDSIQNFISQPEFANFLSDWHEKQDSANTFSLPTPIQAGTMLIFNQQHWDTLSAGNEGEHLIITNGVPSWQKCLPTIATIPPSLNGSQGFAAGGKINPNINSPIYEKGVCWSKDASPQINDKKMMAEAEQDSFMVFVSNIESGVSYHVRAYASNLFGTAYGESYVVHLPLLFGSCYDAPYVVDVEGNYYNTVQIGSQCWMRENLRTTCFADGQPIKSIYTPQYDYYGEISSSPPELFALCGYYYNWETIMRGAVSSENIPSGVQGICPTNWHVPSKGEWQMMSAFVETHFNGASSSTVALAKDKESWQSVITSQIPNTPGYMHSIGFNSIGFSAFPTGFYNFFMGKNGSFCEKCNIGMYALWASSTEALWGSMIVGGIKYDSANLLLLTYAKENGYAVRCVKD